MSNIEMILPKYEPKQRELSMDLLRITACFMVVILHTSASEWTLIDKTSFPWQVIHFYDSLVRSAVPIFVMISGSFMLSKDIPIKLLYKKYVLGIFIPFVFWTFLCSVYSAGITDFSFSAQFTRSHA